MSLTNSGARSLVVAAAILALLLLPGCAAYVGDGLLKLPREAVAYDETDVIEKARQRVRDLVEGLGLPAERGAALLALSPSVVAHDEYPLDLGFIENQLVLAGVDSKIAFARDSIIIAAGSLHVSHSGNNVIVSGGDVDISHDGSLAAGSLVVARGRITIGHAAGTLIYAPGGVEISHARDVRAFNTPDRQTSHGHINNLIVGPLFRGETSPGK